MASLRKQIQLKMRRVRRGGPCGSCGHPRRSHSPCECKEGLTIFDHCDCWDDRRGNGKRVHKRARRYEIWDTKLNPDGTAVTQSYPNGGYGVVMEPTGVWTPPHYNCWCGQYK